MQAEFTDAEQARFWAKVDSRGEGCWLWTGARVHLDGKLTYGEFSLLRRRRTPTLAHRVAWEMSVGSIPEDLLVLHHCDNPPCVRPDHLFLGTYGDNLHDAIVKGRAHPPRGGGTGFRFEPGHADRTRPDGRHGPAKLTWQEVAEIRSARASGSGPSAIARAFGLHRTTVQRITNGQSWREARREPG